MIRTELVAPIGELVGRQAARRPGALAFQDVTRSLTYGDLAERSALCASFLQQAGVERGQRVAIYLPNSVDWVEACVGIIRADAVAVPISFEATDDEVLYRLADANCEAVFTRPSRADKIRDLCTTKELAVRVVEVEAGEGMPYLDEGGTPLSASRDPLDVRQPAFIIYTSGTTGRAKGVLLSLYGILWVTSACWAPILGLNEDDHVLNALPFYHSYALNLAVVSIIATGASEYIMEHFSTSKTAELLSEQKFTVLPGVPTVFHYLLEKAKESGRRSLSGVRICMSAGAVLQGSLNREFEEWFGVTLLDGYGITETSTMVTVNWPVGTRVPGSCGLPLPGLSTRIVDRDGHDVDTDSEGELIVRGPNVMLGYHNNPEATAAALAEGWYRTGDLACRDRFGFITITGRSKEVIIRGGQNIAPVELEECIQSYPDVLDCAVAGVPHAFLGEVPIAFIIPRPGHLINEEAILHHCREHLSAYKVPQAIRIVTEIPRTGSGKVQRFKLKELATATESRLMVVSTATKPVPRESAIKETLIRNDSVDRTLGILSDAWSFLVLREVYLGATRFDQLKNVLHIPRSTLSDRLNRLHLAGLLDRRPVAQGSTRGEYRLTPKGLDLYLVMLAMLRFGDDWLAGDKPPPLILIHEKCGHRCHPETICSECRKPVDPLEVTYRDGPGAGFSPAPEQPQRRRTGGVETFERGRPSSVSRTLGILADRWTFLVLRELFFGVRRFDGFMQNLGIAPNILTDRLLRLVDQNILKKIKYQDFPARYEYKLTKMGRDLYGTFAQMLRWGDQWLGYEPPLILHHKVCGKDFKAIVACDHCGEAIDPHEMRYRLTYKPLRDDHPPALLPSEAD
jgi:acyl-CoA synthetase (AMP-forming)/AMP-acid ligase II/DNA-binding HxlR family transcriptional regulator